MNGLKRVVVYKKEREITFMEGELDVKSLHCSYVEVT